MHTGVYDAHRSLTPQSSHPSPYAHTHTHAHRRVRCAPIAHPAELTVYDAHLDRYACMHVLICTHMYTYVLICTHVAHTYACSSYLCMYACRQAELPVCEARFYTHAYTCTYACTYTYTICEGHASGHSGRIPTSPISPHRDAYPTFASVASSCDAMHTCMHTGLSLPLLLSRRQRTPRSRGDQTPRLASAGWGRYALVYIGW